MFSFNTAEQTLESARKVAAATTNTAANYWSFTDSPKTLTYTRTSATPASSSKFTFYTHTSDGNTGVKLPPNFTIGNMVSLSANFTVVNTIPEDTQNTDSVVIFFTIYTKPKRDGTDRASWYNSRIAITPQINTDNNGHRIISGVSYTITPDHFGAVGTVLSTSYSASDFVNYIIMSSNSIEPLINWKLSLDNVFVTHNIVVPTVIQMTPTFGTTNTLLNITGINLANTSSVKIQDNNTSFTINSSTSIHATVVASAGNASVVLTDTSGNNASFEGSFFYRNPGITSLSPSTGTNNTLVNITGENLSNTSVVQIGDINLSYVVNSSVSVSTRAPNLSNGSTTVTAIDNLGNRVSYPGFIYANPLTISMNSSGAPKSNLRIDGENLANTSVVQFNNTSTTFTAFSEYINVSVPVGYGNSSVRVIDNVGNVNLVGNFLYKTPVLTGMVPETSMVLDTITLYGLNLANTSYVSFGNTRTSSFTVSSNSMNVSVPIGNGNVSVTATDIYGNDTSYSKKFVYINTFISDINPSVSPPKSNVRLTGGLFTNTSTVYFGNLSTPFVIESATSINASVPDSSGNVSISLYDRYEYETYYNKNFRYQLMTIDNVSPLNQVKNGTITLTGQELSLVQSVRVGSSTATFRILSNTQLRITVPAPTGNNKIVLTDMYGNTVTSVQDFVTRIPTVTSIDKTSALIGDTLTLSGTYLTDMNYVVFGLETAKNVVITESQITCTIPYGVGTVNIQVTDNNMNTIVYSNFTYIPDTPVPKVVLAYTPTFTIFDASDIYSSSGTKVTKNNALLYEDTVPVSGIAVDGNMLYICEPSVYKVAKYNMTTRTKLSIQLPTTAQPNIVKVYNKVLYVMCNADPSTTNTDYLYIFDLTQNTVQSMALLPAYTFQGFVKGQTKVTNVLTDCLYYSAITKNTPSQGRVCLADMNGSITNESFMTGISNPIDLLYLNGQLYIDGNTVILVNVSSPSNALATYQSNASSQYNSVYYGTDGSGNNVIYMINANTGIVETITAPSVLTPSILANTMSPSTGLQTTRVFITGQNFLSSDYTPQIKGVTFQSVAATNFTIVSTSLLYCDAPAGGGNAAIHLVDLSDNPISTSLFYVYQSPAILDAYPRESGANDSMYIYGKNLNLVTSVFIGPNAAQFELIRNDYMRIIIPTGSGSNLAITLTDTLSNTITNPNLTFSYYVFNSTICFPAGTLVLSDQGEVAIQLLVPGKHTLHGKDILAITDTYSMDAELVCIEKDALRKNYPRIQTYISPRHKIYYKGKMKAAYLFVGKKGVSFVPNEKEKLYNVLLEDYDTMNVHGLICETLHPTNPVAKHFLKREMLKQKINELTSQN